MEPKPDDLNKIWSTYKPVSRLAKAGVFLIAGALVLQSIQLGLMVWIGLDKMFLAMQITGMILFAGVFLFIRGVGERNRIQEQLHIEPLYAWQIPSDTYKIMRTEAVQKKRKNMMLGVEALGLAGIGMLWLLKKEADWDVLLFSSGGIVLVAMALYAAVDMAWLSPSEENAKVVLCWARRFILGDALFELVEGTGFDGSDEMHGGYLLKVQVSAFKSNPEEVQLWVPKHLFVGLKKAIKQ
jgi:hypothetical protein